MLANFTEMQLNEIFDADSVGTVYPVTNLTPKAKVPQMLHIRVPGTNDLVVRLTHLDTVGTRVKAVLPNDKTVQVFLMSLSDRGNITDFRGGLGDDPVGAINTIFATVMDIAKKYRFESILFRFTKTKLKGQGPAVKRIMGRMIKNRSGGRFTDLEEVTRAESKKFDFVMAIRKNSDLVDELTKSPEGYTKVDTKAGEVFVNDTTGENVSKAAVAAEVLVKQSSKITDQIILSKSKVARQDTIRALYSKFEDAEKDYSPELATVRLDFLETPPIITTGEVDKRISKSINSRLDDIRIPSLYGAMEGSRDLERLKVDLMIDDRTLESELDSAVEIINKFTIENSDVIALQLFEHYAQYDRTKQILYTRAALYKIRSRLQQALVETPMIGYTEDDAHVISSYTNTSYDEINPFLNGNFPRANKIHISDQITKLDAAFENGTILPKGTVVYRGMEIDAEQFKNMMKTKRFYFKGYVSTSLYPIIFAGGFGNVMNAVIEPSKTIDSTGTITVGFIIKGLDKLKSIVCGNMSGHPSECEVILPRGLMIKITNASYAYDKALVEASVLIDDESLAESTDGAMDIGTFTKLFNEAYVYEKPNDLSEFLALLDTVPTKFKV